MNQFSAPRLKQITSTSVLISAVSAFAFLGVARLTLDCLFCSRFVNKKFLFACTIILMIGGCVFGPGDPTSV